MKENNRTHTRGPAYYILTIRAEQQHSLNQLIFSNSERASIIAALQDCLGNPLSLHPIEASIPRHLKLAHYIDLLGFSITRTHISLVVFSVSRPMLRNLGAYLINRLRHFQQDEYTSHPRAILPHVRIIRLPGPYMALHSTLVMHASHTDWEYDRYSSIGFYLHDRRGDWMRLWRMTSLYKNSPIEYRRMLLCFIDTYSSNQGATPWTSARM